MRVLLVDDNPDVRQALTAALQAIPGVVLLGEAADGVFAVPLAHSMRPDVIIMDLDMPIMDGIEATRMICADCPSVRVIGLALEQPAQRVQAMLDAGASICVGSSEALSTLVRALARHSAHPGAADAHDPDRR